MESVYLTAAQEAAQAAEEIIRFAMKEGFSSSRKMDRSPVTQADVEVEVQMRQILKAHFPDHGFLGEEGREERIDAEYVWVLDPIDGTKNLLRHLPFFGTQIALFHEGRAIFGLSHAPELHQQLYAQRGMGAYLNGELLHVSDVQTVENAFISFGGLKYFDRYGKLSSLVNLGENSFAQRGFGDFWAYHLLALGKVDAVIEAKTHVWDIAAVSVVIEEAGGRVTDFDARPISFETSSVVATNGLLHKETLAFFQ